MLSRVAENLFWIGRYIERAENVARVVDAARRMSSLPNETGRGLTNEWSSILVVAGARETFGPAYERADAGAAVDHLLFSENNPSSVARCIHAARENAREVRFAITRECWEILNTAWSEMRRITPLDATGAGLSDVIDWIKAQSALFRGALIGTMLRDDGYSFMRMGGSVERFDYTARMIDVKYHVLLPSLTDIGAHTDHYQWLSLLQASAGYRAYVHVTKSEITARGVGEFLILEKSFPRSLLYNTRRIAEHLRNLSSFYGRDAACGGLVDGYIRELESKSIDDIFDQGLHEFLTDAIDRNYQIANALANSYGFGSFESVATPDGSPATDAVQ